MGTDIVQRVANGKFAPGVSGNPKGRPKQFGELVELARSHTVHAIEKLREVIDDPKTPAMARVKAIELMLNRGHGVPALETDIATVLAAGEVMSFVFKLGETDTAPLAPPVSADLDEIVGELVEDAEPPA